MTDSYSEFMEQATSRCDGHELVDINVERPKHYVVFPAMNNTDRELEAIQIMARTMSVSMFYGYCYGCFMKYRLRLGEKDAGKVLQDLGKSNKYKRLFDENKHLCYDYEVAK